MAINFPNGPTNLDTYTDPTTGVTYTYNSSTSSWTGKSANSTVFVDLTDTQTIDGSKIFVQTINGNITGDVTGDLAGNVVGDVTGNVTGNAGTVTNGVYTVGDQTIGGTKTFSSTIIGDLTGDVNGNVTGNVTGGITGNVTGNVTGNAGTVTNGVYTVGNQTIGGTKTFSSTISGNISSSTSNINTVVTGKVGKTDTVGGWISFNTGVTGSWLGFKATYGADNNKKGLYRYYKGNGTAYHDVYFSGNTNREISFPDASGTVALTSSKVDNATNADYALRASDSDRVNVNATGSNVNYRMIFTEPSDSTDTSGTIYKDSAAHLFYNPSTNVLSCSNFNGNASTATNASNATNATNATNASNAALLDGIDSSQFLRSDATDVKTAGNLTFNDDIALVFGNGLDARFFKNGSYLYLDLVGDLLAGGFKIRKAAVDKYTFSATGDLTTGGDLTAGGKVTSGSRFVAAKSTGANVAYQQLDNSNSGFGFPNNDDVAIYSSGNKTLVATKDKSLLLGAGSSTGLNPGGTGSNWGIYMNSSGQVTHKRDSGINSGYCFKTGGESGALEVRNDGDCLNTNGRYEQGSDVRIKDNVIDAKSQWEDIKALRWVNYNYKPETNMPQHTQLGIVAQEAEDVCPGLISEGEVENTNWNEELKAEVGESYKTVAYSIIAMKSAAALKEAMIRIEELEAKMEALENK